MRNSSFLWTPRSAFFLLLLGAIVALTMLAGCGGDKRTPSVQSETPTQTDGTTEASDEGTRTATAAPPERGSWTIENVRQFDDFAAYWVGEEFQDLPLTRITRFFAPDALVPEDSITFIYGTCTPSAGDGGCLPPLQIIVEPYCYEQPQTIAEEAKEGPVIQIREGADAQVISGGLRIWTGDVSVKIYDDTLEVKIYDDTPESELEMVVAEALITANGLGPTSADEPLPPVDADCSHFDLVEPHPDALR